MQMAASGMPAMAPLPAPVVATAKAPISRAACNAKQTFLLLPEVEMPTTTSPGARADHLNLPAEGVLVSIVVADCRQTDVSVVRAMDVKPERSRRKHPTNSAARCCESAALPASPHRRTALCPKDRPRHLGGDALQD